MNVTPRPYSLLLSVSDMAELLSTSPRTIHRLNATGGVPEPLRIGARPRWRRVEIEEWIEAGCPDREKWGRIKR